MFDWTMDKVYYNRGAAVMLYGHDTMIKTIFY